MNVESLDRLLDCDTAASMLGVTPGTLRVWTCKKEIPFVKLRKGRAVRYRLSTLQRLIETWELKPDTGGEA